jgi:hypothetical protein
MLIRFGFFQKSLTLAQEPSKKKGPAGLTSTVAITAIVRARTAPSLAGAWCCQQVTAV